MVGTWLGECCRQVEAEEISNSRNKINQTMYQPLFPTLYKFLTHLKPYCVSLSPTNSKLDVAQGADEGGAREGIYIERLSSPVIVNKRTRDKEHFLFLPSSRRRHKRHVFSIPCLALDEARLASQLPKLLSFVFSSMSKSPSPSYPTWP